MLDTQQETIDLYKYPAPSDMNSNTITIGDMHANSLKFIYLLIKNGVLKMKPDDYNDLVALYRSFDEAIDKIKLNAGKIVGIDKQDDIQEIIERINEHIKSKIEINNAQIQVRLMGDVLADRRYSDEITLKLLDKLNKGGVKVENILSNHDLEFITSYVNNMEVTGEAFSLIADNQKISLVVLQQSIHNNKISRNVVDQLVKNSYIPTLKVISYTVSEGKITLYTHAPIAHDPIEVVKALANEFNININDNKLETTRDLTDLIDSINVTFQRQLQNKTFQQIDISNRYQIKDFESFKLHNEQFYNEALKDPIKKEKINLNMDMSLSGPIFGSDNPIIYITNYRTYNLNPLFPQHQQIQPTIIENKLIHIICGHDECVDKDGSILPPHMSSLDNSLGKERKFDQNNIVPDGLGENAINKSWTNDTIGVKLSQEKPFTPIQQYVKCCDALKLSRLFFKAAKVSIIAAMGIAAIGILAPLAAIVLFGIGILVPTIILSPPTLICIFVASAICGGVAAISVVGTVYYCVASMKFSVGLDSWPIKQSVELKQSVPVVAPQQAPNSNIHRTATFTEQQHSPNKATFTEQQKARTISSKANEKEPLI